ncbi:MAG: hypothetical protein RBU23_00500 [Candidatus Auribacterota bacterium]|jgi:sensor histidine kinase YesM|nr:hypothetical protein [Candidatus Auribacterota bacterium]
MNTKTNPERPAFFRRKYLINSKLQLRISMAMVLEVALITATMSLILLYVNDYYLGLITYFVGSAEAEQISLSDISRGMYYFIIGGVAFSSVVFALIGIFVSHKIAGPLYRLKRYMTIVRNGRYSHEIRFRKDDQLHDMADIFNQMVMSLEIRKEIDLLYVERMEKLINELVFKNKSAVPASNETIAKLAELQEILGQIKSHKTFIYDNDDNYPYVSYQAGESENTPAQAESVQQVR